MSKEAVVIMSGRRTIPPGGSVSSDFWVASGFSSVRGTVRVSEAHAGSRVRIVQSSDSKTVGRERKVPLIENGRDARIVEPVVAGLVKVEVENGSKSEIEAAIDIQLRRERVDPDELAFRDFFHDVVEIGPDSEFEANMAAVERMLGRPATSVRISPDRDGLLVKVNDLSSMAFEVSASGRTFDPRTDRLEVCRLWFSNSGKASVRAEVFAS